MDHLTLLLSLVFKIAFATAEDIQYCGNTPYHPSQFVSVPGGQQYYIEPNGALGFTQTHSASVPTGSVYGGTAYENGEFKYLPGQGWYVCPTSTVGQWQLFQKLGGVSFDSACVGLNVLTKNLDANRSYAWQYT
ncbi:uncharacterized protein K452DRAFT_298790 [Aplosporella prunicola CBS 121167]|uniref:Uncharacterized protein n=1 Tax=Aplosporella prunicola CBS 121167 TaxID=1176127 RepID=A0A6A6BBB6_9PEZI|nr:uncharacterized protein K452DRAFT_298790 [Aplosporella prunicola CBS 121167]KAF2141410.1 hypothetical protein K452DRAFT_298790 [Aplosporella prunicola CBS 121167]